MPNLPFSPANPVQPSDFIKNDIPAETDDLQLGQRPSEGADPKKPDRDRDRPATVPDSGRH